MSTQHTQYPRVTSYLAHGRWTAEAWATDGMPGDRRIATVSGYLSQGDAIRAAIAQAKLTGSTS
jgi:hypothetical protein